jgi:hypothetical protein
MRGRPGDDPSRRAPGRPDCFDRRWPADALSADTIAGLRSAIGTSVAENVPLIIVGRKRLFSAGFDLEVIHNGHQGLAGPRARSPRVDRRRGPVVALPIRVRSRSVAEPTTTVNAPRCYDPVADGRLIPVSGSWRLGVAVAGPVGQPEPSSDQLPFIHVPHSGVGERSLNPEDSACRYHLQSGEAECPKTVE